jgi:hypothetical protein
VRFSASRIRIGRLRVGLVLVAAYLAAVLFAALLAHRVLPMFDTAGGTVPYRWVKPPAAFASTNVPPEPNDTDIQMGPTGSQQSGAQSGDNQLVLNLAPNAVPPHPPDTTLRVHIEPLDPSKVGPVPPDLRANGNAYRVSFSYQPSGVPASTVRAPGNVLLTVPLAPTALLYSGDGRTWTNVATQTLAVQFKVGGPFNAVGWFLGGAHPQTAPASSSSGSVIIVAVLVGVLALALGLFPFILKRRRR